MMRAKSDEELARIMGNSSLNKPAKDAGNLSQAENGALRQIVDAIDKLEQEKAALSEQIADRLKAAEEDGWSKKRIREVLKQRKRRRKNTRQAIDAAQIEFDLYWNASGGDEAVSGAAEEGDDATPVMDRGAARSFN